MLPMLGNMVGTRGRVTGRIGPGLVGEVLLPIRGGVEAFYAYAVDPNETIENGTQVLVVDFTEPRSVYVERWASLR